MRQESHARSKYLICVMLIARLFIFFLFFLTTPDVGGGQTISKWIITALLKSSRFFLRGFSFKLWSYTMRWNLKWYQIEFFFFLHLLSFHSQWLKETINKISGHVLKPNNPKNLQKDTFLYPGSCKNIKYINIVRLNLSSINHLLAWWRTRKSF